MQFKKQNQTDSVITLSTKQNHQNFLQKFNQVIITMEVRIEDKKLVIITEPII